jgi:hypothetical protein
MAKIQKSCYPPQVAPALSGRSAIGECEGIRASEPLLIAWPFSNSKAPNYKHQITNKFKARNSNSRNGEDPVWGIRACSLVFVCDLVLVIWNFLF